MTGSTDGRVRGGRTHWLASTLAAAAVMASAGGSLGAQTQVAFSVHGSQDYALPGAPHIYGASIATYTGIFGLRGGGAMGQLRTIDRGDGEERTEIGAWTADADFIIAPAQVRAIRTALGGLGPYGFVGIGTHGVQREPMGEKVRGPVWSYGAGLAQPLLGALYLEAEARYRLPMVRDGESPPPGFTRAREYRLGISLRFGGGGKKNGGGWDHAREP
jgi:hypothetical protein